MDNSACSRYMYTRDARPFLVSRVHQPGKYAPSYDRIADVENMFRGSRLFDGRKLWCGHNPSHREVNRLQSLHYRLAAAGKSLCRSEIPHRDPSNLCPHRRAGSLCPVTTVTRVTVTRFETKDSDQFFAATRDP